jgi:outer membrane protein OmpA-like peptidoglycan-associated protein
LLGQAFRRDEGERFDLEPVSFAPGSTELSPDANTRIAQVAHLLERHAGLRVVLRSMPTDADVPGTPDATPERLQTLGASRVAAVARRLTSEHGIDARRVETGSSEVPEIHVGGQPGVDIRLRIE